MGFFVITFWFGDVDGFKKEADFVGLLRSRMVGESGFAGVVDDEVEVGSVSRAAAVIWRKIRAVFW
jgi:hypothetical protein